MNNRRVERWGKLVGAALGAGAISALLSLLLSGVGWISNLELRLHQETQIDVKPARNSPEIVLVTIKKPETVTALAGKSGVDRLPRRFIAEFIERLRDAGGKSLLIDIAFDEADEEEDHLLQAAVATCDPLNVVLGIPLKGDQRDETETIGFSRSFALSYAFPGIEGEHYAMGPITLFAPDGIVRGFEPVIEDSELDMVFPHAAMAAVLFDRDISPDSLELDLENGVVKAGSLSWPTGGEGVIPIQWPRTREDAFKTFEFRDALKLLEDKEDRTFQDKIVVLGYYDYLDVKSTPIGNLVGVECIAMAVNSLLERPGPPERATQGVNMLWAFLLGVGGGLASHSRRWFTALGAGLAVIGLGAYAPRLFLQQGNVWLDLFSPTAGGIISLALTSLVFAAVQGRLMDRFLPQWAREKRQSGQEEVVTILFVDLRSSTQTVVEIGLTETEKLLKRVLVDVSSAITESGGEVERIMGDGIFAIFRQKKNSNHALLALHSIPRMLRAIEKIDEDLARSFGRHASLSIGLESGPIIGATLKTGTEESWSSFGATIHLAARIQAAAGKEPFTGHEILLGPEFVRLTGKPELFTEAGSFHPRGFPDIVSVYVLDIDPRKL